MQRIYLDHNATTPLSGEVRDAMMGALTLPGNSSSIHHEGQLARAAMEEARRQVASLIGSAYPDILFTSGATEANNLAIETLATRTQGALMTSRIEHPSVLAPMQRLQAEGREVLFLEVDARGMLPPVAEIMQQAEAAGVSAFSLMMANNETGNLSKIQELAHAGREKGWMTHTDATQAVGKLPVAVEALGVDMLSLSGHKIYGPTGVGALWASPDVTLRPLILGGHQERGRRGGTENLAGAVAMGVAASLCQRHVMQDMERIGALRDKLWAGIEAMEPDAVRQTDVEACLPNTLNVRFSRVDGETLLINLDLEGISVSAGSACTAGSLEPSHVILAMGVPEQDARGSVRFSLGRHTTPEEIDEVLRRLPVVLSRTRCTAW